MNVYPSIIKDSNASNSDRKCFRILLSPNQWSSEITPLIIYLQSTTTLMKTYLLFKLAPNFVKFSFSFDEGHVFRPGRSCSFSSTATGWHSGVSHDCSDGVLLGSLQRTKQLIVWWCENQTVEWVQQHHSSKNCDGTCGSNTDVCTSTVMKEHNSEIFLLLRSWWQWHSDFLMFQHLLEGPESFLKS
jgi:hypothetical protein